MWKFPGAKHVQTRPEQLFIAYGLMPRIPNCCSIVVSITITKGIQNQPCLDTNWCKTVEKNFEQRNRSRREKFQIIMNIINQKFKMFKITEPIYRETILTLGGN